MRKHILCTPYLHPHGRSAPALRGWGQPPGQSAQLHHPGPPLPSARPPLSYLDSKLEGDDPQQEHPLHEAEMKRIISLFLSPFAQFSLEKHVLLLGRGTQRFRHFNIKIHKRPQQFQESCGESRKNKGHLRVPFPVQDPSFSLLHLRMGRPHRGPPGKMIEIMTFYFNPEGGMALSYIRWPWGSHHPHAGIEHD